MSRLRRIETTARFFFVTTNLSRRVPMLSPAERDICLGLLDQTRSRFRFSLHAYVVMPDHAHMLIGAFSCSLPELMRHWKAQSALAIAKARSASGPIWQARYFDFIPRRVSDFWQKMECIHHNPVEQGLVSEITQWRWSSVGFYSKTTVPPIAVDMPHLPLDANAPLWPMHGKATF